MFHVQDIIKNEDALQVELRMLDRTLTLGFTVRADIRIGRTYTNTDIRVGITICAGAVAMRLLGLLERWCSEGEGNLFNWGGAVLGVWLGGAYVGDLFGLK